MNGKAIVIDAVFGIYKVKIVNFDEGHRIERNEGGLTRNKAYEIAASWNKETSYPVRIQFGTNLSNVEKREINQHKTTQL